VTKDNQWITVQEAARRLGVKEDAIRKRMQRGTLKYEKDPKDGRVYVYMDATQDGSYDGTYDASQDATEHASYAVLVEALREQVADLRDQVTDLRKRLDQENEANRENRRIIAGLVQRVPELEPAKEAPSEPREASVSPPEESGNSQVPPDGERPSWWRRLLGS
jgi:excisionase family DNA binding protein